MEIKQEERHHAGSFFLKDKGRDLGEMRYLLKAGIMDIYHTEVDPAWKGHNLGFELVEAGVRYARENKLKIRPTCPFARSVLEHTPDFRDIRLGKKNDID